MKKTCLKNILGQKRNIISEVPKNSDTHHPFMYYFCHIINDVDGL